MSLTAPAPGDTPTLEGADETALSSSQTIVGTIVRLFFSYTPAGSSFTDVVPVWTTSNGGSLAVSSDGMSAEYTNLNSGTETVTITSTPASGPAVVYGYNFYWLANPNVPTGGAIQAFTVP